MERRADEGKARNRPGSSRVDLVVAIVCLGALATMAVPRQQELNASTRRGSVEALGESVRSAAQFGHALWEAQGGPAALQVTRGRVAIINGYPAPGDVALLLETPETMGFAGRGGHWQHEAVDATRGCGLSYAPPTAMGSVPRVTLHLDGC